MQSWKVSDDLLLTPIDDKDYLFDLLVYVMLAIRVLEIQLSERAHLANREDSEPQAQINLY